MTDKESTADARVAGDLERMTTLERAKAGTRIGTIEFAAIADEEVDVAQDLNDDARDARVEAEGTGSTANR
jgi:hypothetical protein